MRHATFLSPSRNVRQHIHYTTISQSGLRFTTASLNTRGLRMSTGIGDSGLNEVSQAQELVGVYEAVIPSTETLIGMGLVVLLCVACVWYWNENVVPVSRTNLAISKSRGEVKEYLDELRGTVPRMQQMSNTSTPTIGNGTSLTTVEHDEPVDAPKPNSRAIERWLFADWLVDNKSEKRAGRRKEPALPILKDAKWNSGDNPVVVAGFLMVVGLISTALAERISSVISSV